MKIPPRGFSDTQLLTRRVPYGWDVTVEVRALEPDTEDRAIVLAFCQLVDYFRSRGADPVKMAANAPPPHAHGDYGP